MSKIIIGIHGLGNKPEYSQLEEWWRAAIMEGMEPSRLRWLLRFKLAYWASILHPEPYNPHETDRSSPLYLREPYARGSEEFVRKDRKDIRKQIRDLINNQMEKVFLEEDGTLNFEGLTDFILKRYFRDLSSYYSDIQGVEESLQPRELIRQRLTDVLMKNRRKKILLIAHSMGSIVALDVLIRYAGKIKIDTLVTIGSPLGNPVVKSRMLSDLKTESPDTKVLKTPDSIESAWYNLADFNDKVASNYDLENDFIPNRFGIKPQDKFVFNNYMYEGESNPHKSYGYLRCPEMAEIVNGFIKWNFIRKFNNISN